MTDRKLPDRITFRRPGKPDQQRDVGAGDTVLHTLERYILSEPQLPEGAELVISEAINRRLQRDLNALMCAPILYHPPKPEPAAPRTFMGLLVQVVTC